jgi:hypothetical protein
LYLYSVIISGLGRFYSFYFRVICDSTIFSKQTRHFRKLEKTQQIVHKKCTRLSLAVFLFIVFYCLAFLLVLEDKDILQIDASIIAGALIFLTVASVAIETQDARIDSVVLGSSIILIFGVSAIYVSFGRTERGRGAMKLGFVILVAMMIFQMALTLWSAVADSK